MRRIVAIGGGEIRASETYEIDAHIVGLAKKKNPTAPCSYPPQAMTLRVIGRHFSPFMATGCDA